LKAKAQSKLFYLAVCVLTATCAVSVGLVSADSSIRVSGAKQRVVKRWAFASEPILVTNVQAQSASVQSDRPFAAGDEWLRGLRFDVLNKSLQSIAFVKVHVLLYGVKGYEGALSIPLQWGEPPLLSNGAVVSRPIDSLTPGNKVSLAVTAEMYARVKGMVEKQDTMANVSEVRLLTSSVMYTDGTVWKGGSLLYPDEKRAGVWTERKDDLAQSNSYLPGNAAYGHANIIKASMSPAGCKRVSGSIFISCCSGECFVTPQRATFANDRGCAQAEPITISCQPCSIQTCLNQEAVPCEAGCS
jgi:hypothetical protein